VHHEVDEAEKEVTNASREKCVTAVRSVISHHCNDHRHCVEEDCQYLHIKHMLKVRQQQTGKGYTVQEIASEYAKVSRFKGASLSIHREARNKVIHVIMQRVNLKNVDRLAMAMSSNLCEQYFSMLVKFSQGKRLNLCQSDAWKVVQLFVAGLSSDSTFIDKLLKEAGGSDSIVRSNSRTRIAHKKDVDAKRKKKDEYLFQKQAAKSMRLRCMEKEGASSAAHKPDKVKPTDACRSGKLGAKTRKPDTCSNCGQLGHKCHRCKEPKYNAAQKEPATVARKKKQRKGNPETGSDIIKLFLKK